MSEGSSSLPAKWSLPASPLDCPPALVKREDNLKYKEILQPKKHYSAKQSDKDKNIVKKAALKKEKEKQKLLYEAEKLMRKIESRSSEDLVDPTFGQFRLKHVDEKEPEYEKIYIENNAKDAIRKMRLKLTANDDNSLNKELSLAEKKLFVSPYGQPLSHKLMTNLGYSGKEA